MGIREISGKHLRLWTDVPASPAVDELPRAFDAAIAEWANYFGVAGKSLDVWQVQGFLIRDREKFAALKLLPEGHAELVNGYALGNELWLEEQPSDYYRRHLLLHEGTHSFMLAFLGQAGPGWYMEGTAELLGTHRWQEDQLALNVLPATRQEAPFWGRIKLIRDAHAQGSALSLGEVLSISNREALSTDAYAWCWALSKFLDAHPTYGEKFRQLPRLVTRSDFNRRFRRLYRVEWRDLNFEWDGFVAALDYGYDTQQMAMQHRPAEPVDKPASTTIAAERGWQSSGWLLRAGISYRITATGRFQIAREDSPDQQPWPCEPGGVTLRYHEGNPLGMLLGVLRPVKPTEKMRVQPRDGGGTFAQPLALGLAATIRPTEDAILYLRVNDSAAQLSDNRGNLTVQIESLPPDSTAEEATRPAAGVSEDGGAPSD